MNAPVSLYHFTPKASATFAELDEVRRISATRTKYRRPLLVGSEGTILATWVTELPILSSPTKGSPQLG